MSNKRQELLVFYIARKVEQRRVILKLSQSDLAKKTGLSKATISRIESCINSVMPETLYKLAIAMQCEVFDFLPSKRWYMEHTGKKVKRKIVYEITD